MSVFLASFLLLAGLSGAEDCGQGGNSPPTSLQALLSPQEFGKYQKKPRYKDRIEQFRNALERYSLQVERDVRGRRAEPMQQTLRSISCLAYHILQEPTRENFPKDQRSKQVKKMEIRLRKLIDLLDDAKYSFSFEMQQRFDHTLKDLHEVREQMLQGLFGESLGKGGSQPRMPGGFGFVAAHPSPPSPAPAPQRRNKPRYQEFTEEELADLRMYQDLKKRVEIFLEIAERRLDEIHLRMTGKEYEPPPAEQAADEGQKKKGKKHKKKKQSEKADSEQPNPLEFFTYTDLVYGYERAVDGITVNVDDKYKRTPEKDLRKALQKVNEKVQGFIPRLAAVKELAVQQKDEELYRQVERAERISEIALKGSQMFLGAPEK